MESDWFAATEIPLPGILWRDCVWIITAFTLSFLALYTGFQLVGVPEICLWKRKVSRLLVRSFLESVICIQIFFRIQSFEETAAYFNFSHKLLKPWHGLCDLWHGLCNPRHGLTYECWGIGIYMRKWKPILLYVQADSPSVLQRSYSFYIPIKIFIFTTLWLLSASQEQLFAKNS